ncbi:MAG: hypothetical protein ACTSU5_06075, partial [Promethearchaeota archaeon]
MVEINLDDLEAWYQSFLSKKYAKLRRNAKKILEKIVKIMFDMRGAIDRMEQAEVNITDEVTKKSVTRFISKMREQFDTLEIPEEVTYEQLRNLVEEIKRLFQNLQPIIKQNVRKFATEYKNELKEFDFISRKLSSEHVKLDRFMHDKYANAKEAEGLLARTDRLYQTIERIHRLKVKGDDLDAQKAELQAKIAESERKLLELENHEELKKLASLEQAMFQIKNDFRDHLKFRKVLTKVKRLVDKGVYSVRDV